MKACRTRACGHPAERGLSFCGVCLEAWNRTRTLPVVEPPAVVVAMPVPVTVSRPWPTTEGHRCSSCGLVFPLLVDDVLCIRCDSLHYPSNTTWSVAS